LSGVISHEEKSLKGQKTNCKKWAQGREPAEEIRETTKIFVSVKKGGERGGKRKGQSLVSTDIDRDGGEN